MYSKIVKKHGILWRKVSSDVKRVQHTRRPDESHRFFLFLYDEIKLLLRAFGPRWTCLKFAGTDI